VKNALLLEVLAEPGLVAGLAETEWDVLVRQARHANLLGRLSLLLDASGVDVPLRASRHFRSGATMAARQRVGVRSEVLALQKDLAPLGQPLILLKGGAYVLADLPAARGRVFGDIDILVPAAVLGEVESQLLQRGWSVNDLDDYDQRYYRRWMHELPPLQHVFRGTALDVHHTLLPPTAGRPLNAERMFEDRVAVPGFEGVFTLCPTDMVLHSATHLFHEGEPDNLLRDLSDLDLLLRHFGCEAEFWPGLQARAELHGLVDDLRLALRYVALLLATPIPESLQGALQPQKISGFADSLRHAMFLRVLQPMHDTASDRWTSLSRWALYVRSHWLKMPLPLLVLHLAHKAFFPPKTKQIDTDQR
jgi:Uncharacterised nucleotidyltransferase